MQIMDRDQRARKPLPEPMTTRFTDAYISGTQPQCVNALTVINHMTLIMAHKNFTYMHMHSWVALLHGLR